MICIIRKVIICSRRHVGTTFFFRFLSHSLVGDSLWSYIGKKSKIDGAHTAMGSTKKDDIGNPYHHQCDDDGQNSCVRDGTTGTAALVVIVAVVALDVVDFVVRSSGLVCGSSGGWGKNTSISIRT